MLLTNARGRSLARLTYGPWGEEPEGDLKRTRFTYTGHQREARTGHYYSVWRYLDPRVGRWTQRDPLRLEAADSENLYAYPNNRATVFSDPLGLCSWANVLKILQGTDAGQQALLGADQVEPGQFQGLVTYVGRGDTLPDPPRCRIRIQNS